MIGWEKYRTTTVHSCITIQVTSTTQPSAKECARARKRKDTQQLDQTWYAFADDGVEVVRLEDLDVGGLCACEEE
jgi:hypothetical protein